MDVGVRVLRAVHLDDPVDSRKIDSTRDDVGGKEARVLRGGEAVCDFQTGNLLLPSMQVQEGDTRLEMSEALVDEPDLLARAQKDDDLALEICFDEAVQRVELLVERCDDVVLLQVRRGGV